uniref:Uncharacterized protein n=1 Tax=Knipowitschia caucasica TaxID=637954 RepID=A0AAV2MKL1_KNICA
MQISVPCSRPVVTDWAPDTGGSAPVCECLESAPVQPHLPPHAPVLGYSAESHNSVCRTLQPACSAGKIPLTAQPKPPGSMIARAFHRTLDKCQRGRQRGEDL